MLAERLTCNEQVIGSRPVEGSIGAWRNRQRAWLWSRRFQVRALGPQRAQVNLHQGQAGPWPLESVIKPAQMPG